MTDKEMAELQMAMVYLTSEDVDIHEVHKFKVELIKYTVSGHTSIYVYDSKSKKNLLQYDAGYDVDGYCAFWNNLAYGSTSKMIKQWVEDEVKKSTAKK